MPLRSIYRHASYHPIMTIETPTSPSTEPNDDASKAVQLVVVSDFVCPWCFVGLTLVERLRRDYPDIEVAWSPYLLDPSVPPEGRPTLPRQQPGDQPSAVEIRAADAGLYFKRGRTFRPNSMLALETAWFAQEQGLDDAALHRDLYSEHFEQLGNIGEVDTLVRIGAEHALDPAVLRKALETRRYQSEVEQAIEEVQVIGVSAVPTFIFNGEYAIVGAETYPAFQRMMERLGYPIPPGAETPPDTYRLTFSEPTTAPTSED